MSGERRYGAVLGHEGDPDCLRCAHLTSGLRMDERALQSAAGKSARRGVAQADLETTRQHRDRARRVLEEHIRTEHQ